MPVSDKKRVFLNSIIVSAATVSEKLVFFIINVIIARYLNVYDFGEYSTALGYATFFSIFCDIGINQTLIRFINIEKAKEIKYFRQAFFTKIMLSLFVYGLMISSAFLAGYNRSTVFLIFILGLVRVGNEFHKAFYAYFDSKENFRVPSFSSVSFSLMLLVSTGMVVLFKGDYYDLSLARLLSVVVIIIFLYRVSPRVSVSSGSYNDLRYFLKHAVPFGLYSIAGNIMQRANIVILSLIHGTYYAGIFNNANFFFITLFFIPTNFIRVLVPFLYKIKFKDDPDKFRFAFKIFAKVFGIFSFYLLTFFYIFADIIVILFFGEKYYDTIPVLKIISLGIPFIFNVGTIIITSLDKQKYNTFLYLTGAIFNIIINFIMIYFLKAEGAALATVITFALIFILTHIFLWKWGILDLLKFLSLYFVLLGISILCYYVNFQFLIKYHWLLKMSFVSIIYFVLVVLFLIRKDDIRIVKETVLGAKS